MVQFDTKDGVPQFSFLQGGGLSNQFSMNSSGQITSSSGNLTMQLPLPTPISSFGQQEHHHQSIVQSQANQAVQQQTQMSQQANVSQTSQQQQQPTQQQSTQQQQQAQQFVAQNAANFAQFFAQQAGNLMQQQSNAARQQQSQPVPLQPSLPPIQQQAQPPQQQTQQAQLPFTSDPNTFLQQLQFAQLQQQFQAAQAQQQQQQLPNAMQQQLQAHFSQAQAAAAVTSNVPLASAPAPNATQAQPQHPKKQHKVSDGSKSASTRLPPKAKAVSNADIAMISIVSASDTDGEASRRVKSKKSAPSDMMIMAEPPLDMSNMTEAEKVKANRDRNREHARNTRLRKKAYLEKLKTTVDELCRERDSLVSERASTANLLVEMHNTRTEVLMSFFALRTANEKRRKLWSSILDESCFACVMPVTPYRSFPASEVQVSKCLRTIMGIDGMMADTASLHVLLDTLVDRSKYPYDKINFRYTLVTEEAVVAGNQMMARWVMTTTNAVLCGAKMEVTKQGMLCCKFNSAHKIIGLELMFDVMAFMLQLKQAAGSDGFSVIPNTVQTCQRSFDKPMVVTLAEPPYTIIQANQLWMDMTGYTAEDVVGKASCSILQSSDMEKKALKNMMQEIRYKRPASAMLVNTTKSGEIFSNFLVVFPLSTDSRITYFLGLTMYNKEGQPVEADQSKVAAIEALAQNNAVVTSGNIVQQATAAMLPPLMLGLAPQAQIDSVGVMPPPTTSNLSSILNEIPRSGSVLGGLKRPRETPSACVVLQR
jgi:PAS domain S-box-containing protein